IVLRWRGVAPIRRPSSNLPPDGCAIHRRRRGRSKRLFVQNFPLFFQTPRCNPADRANPPPYLPQIRWVWHRPAYWTKRQNLPPAKQQHFWFLADTLLGRHNPNPLFLSRQSIYLPKTK